MSYAISRKIEIDAAHRVPRHGSKCRQLHGHRYIIEAHVSAPDVVSRGEQEGMVVDFGFLKDYMMDAIHETCDHSTILWADDPLWRAFERMWPTDMYEIGLGKLVRCPYVPTAENLACWWFNLLEARINQEQPHATLVRIKVHETPNCWATYPA